MKSPHECLSPGSYQSIPHFPSSFFKLPGHGIYTCCRAVERASSSASTATLLPTPPAVFMEGLADETKTWQRPATAQGCERAPQTLRCWHPLAPSCSVLPCQRELPSCATAGPICVPGDLSAPSSLGTLHRHCHRCVATELPLLVWHQPVVQAVAAHVQATSWLLPGGSQEGWTERGEPGELPHRRRRRFV